MAKETPSGASRQLPQRGRQEEGLTAEDASDRLRLSLGIEAQTNALI